MNKTLKLKDETHKGLEELKSKFGFSSFDETIKKMIHAFNNYEPLKDKNEIKNFEEVVLKSYKKTENRIESIFKRLSYFEKTYLFKLDDINDNISDSKKELYNLISSPSNGKSSDILESKESIISDDNKTELEELNLKYARSLNLIKAKLQKTGGVFSNTYQINLSDDEYNNLF